MLCFTFIILIVSVTFGRISLCSYVSIDVITVTYPDFDIQSLHVLGIECPCFPARSSILVASLLLVVLFLLVVLPILKQRSMKLLLLREALENPELQVSCNITVISVTLQIPTNTGVMLSKNGPMIQPIAVRIVSVNIIRASGNLIKLIANNTSS